MQQQRARDALLGGPIGMADEGIDDEDRVQRMGDTRGDTAAAGQHRHVNRAGHKAPVQERVNLSFIHHGTGLVLVVSGQNKNYKFRCCLGPGH